MTTTFNTTAKDALGLVGSYLSPTEVMAGRETNWAVRSGFESAHRRNLARQRFQWELLFSGVLTANYRQNEEMLSEFGLSTIQLTSGEEEAWRQVRSSLTTPPLNKKTLYWRSTLRSITPLFPGLLSTGQLLRKRIGGRIFIT